MTELDTVARLKETEGREGRGRSVWCMENIGHTHTVELVAESLLSFIVSYTNQLMRASTSR